MPLLRVELEAGHKRAQMVLVGSHSALGWWDPSRGVPMRWTGEAWETEEPISLDGHSGGPVECKFVRLDRDQPQWEEGPCRRLQVPSGAACNLLLQASFNHSAGAPNVRLMTHEELKQRAEQTADAAATEAAAVAVAGHSELLHWQRQAEEVGRELEEALSIAAADEAQFAEEQRQAALEEEALRAELARLREQSAGPAADRSLSLRGLQWQPLAGAPSMVSDAKASSWTPEVTYQALSPMPPWRPLRGSLPSSSGWRSDVDHARSSAPSSVGWRSEVGQDPDACSSFAVPSSLPSRQLVSLPASCPGSLNAPSTRSPGSPPLGARRVAPLSAYSGWTLPSEASSSTAPPRAAQAVQVPAPESFQLSEGEDIDTTQGSVQTYLSATTGQQYRPPTRASEYSAAPWPRRESKCANFESVQRLLQVTNTRHRGVSSTSEEAELAGAGTGSTIGLVSTGPGTPDSSGTGAQGASTGASGRGMRDPVLKGGEKPRAGAAVTGQENTGSFLKAPWAMWDDLLTSLPEAAWTQQHIPPPRSWGL